MWAWLAQGLDGLTGAVPAHTLAHMGLTCPAGQCGHSNPLVGRMAAVFEYCRLKACLPLVVLTLDLSVWAWAQPLLNHPTRECGLLLPELVGVTLLASSGSPPVPVRQVWVRPVLLQL